MTDSKKDLENILAKARNLNQDERHLIKQAYQFAAEKHHGQTRLSNENYLNHPVAVAMILAEQQADADTIAAGLLHETLEDTDTTPQELENKFGPDITFLVKGVTKLGQLKYQGIERHGESLRKLFLATAQDIRTILIRLADRLHNVRTLEFVPQNKQKRIALETLEIYAPIANRLGMWKLKGSLEDSSFPFVYPEAYRQVSELRKTKSQENIKYLKKISRTLQKELAQIGLRNVEVDYRIKYLYSLYLKLKQKDMDIDRIHDISALRVIVPELTDCYQTLGIVHSLWRPLPNRLKDYIANPKPNGYQSLHTTVFTGEDSIAEIQIRSQEMHQNAEYGVASHLIYDEAGKSNRAQLSKKTKWLKRLIEEPSPDSDSGEFLTNLKQDLFQNSIFVFTPKGDVIELPTDSTPIDFAYAIHSDIGNQAVGALIDNKMVSLHTPLKNHDIVKIKTSKKTHPNIKWLDFVKTGLARKQIKSYLQKNNNSNEYHKTSR